MFADIIDSGNGVGNEVVGIDHGNSLWYSGDKPSQYKARTAPTTNNSASESKPNPSMTAMIPRSPKMTEHHEYTTPTVFKHPQDSENSPETARKVMGE
jgi:hypothetical protein